MSTDHLATEIIAMGATSGWSESLERLETLLAGA
jgi:hypothetical protein